MGIRNWHVVSKWFQPPTLMVPVSSQAPTLLGRLLSSVPS